jgi:spermidine synthase
MPTRTLIAESMTPDAERLTLTLEEGHHVVRVRGELLMSSRVSGSEEALAKLALAAGTGGTAPRVLVGGLGIGFTLRAVLDELGPSARVDVLELLEAVVDWNRGPLAAHAGRPLDDPRVTVIVDDVLAHLAAGVQRYDAIVLDVDNGPEAFTVRANGRLYTPAGLAPLHAALHAGGVMVLWSAFRSPNFERRLRRAGFQVTTETVRARGAVRKGARHTVFKAVRPGP